ncbi:hypothetical protein DR864_27750 [Runella rosea]|uniref:Uncharacterized protein n=1 Tax=Runella rosea TaxID=2259595 RepID=A0A344TRJ7_9BACT|nr:hypothetical protein DR864_27750 [Runella rosea]
MITVYNHDYLKNRTFFPKNFFHIHADVDPSRCARVRQTMLDCFWILFFTICIVLHTNHIIEKVKRLKESVVEMNLINFKPYEIMKTSTPTNQFKSPQKQISVSTQRP